MKSRDAKWILLCGAGVGWLVGLSVSPVVGTVVACVIGALAGLTSALTGCDQELNTDSLTRGRYGDFKSMGLLLGGIIIGSVFGVLARTHSWLSPSVNNIIIEWSNGRGMDRNEVAKRLFDERYPPVQITDTAERSVPNSDGKAASPQVTGATPNSSVLFVASTDECTTFRAKNGDELRADMEASVTSPQAREFASRVKDSTALKAAVEVFICR